MKNLNKAILIAMGMALPLSAMASPDDDVTIRMMDVNEHAAEAVTSHIELPDISNDHAREHAANGLDTANNDQSGDVEQDREHDMDKEDKDKEDRDHEMDKEDDHERDMDREDDNEREMDREDDNEREMDREDDTEREMDSERDDRKDVEHDGMDREEVEREGLDDVDHGSDNAPGMDGPDGIDAPGQDGNGPAGDNDQSSHEPT